jgi:hypothetical protein
LRIQVAWSREEWDDENPWLVRHAEAGNCLAAIHVPLETPWIYPTCCRDFAVLLEAESNAEIVLRSRHQ